MRLFLEAVHTRTPSGVQELYTVAAWLGWTPSTRITRPLCSVALGIKGRPQRAWFTQPGPTKVGLKKPRGGQ